jgi:hypothetical protein
MGVIWLAGLAVALLSVAPALAFDISLKVRAKGCASNDCQDFVSDDALKAHASKEMRARIILREEAAKAKEYLLGQPERLLNREVARAKEHSVEKDPQEETSDEKLYESATLRNAHCSYFDRPENYSWLRPEELSDGEAALTELQERARQQQGRFQIAELVGLSKRDEQHIGRCNVKIVDGVVGPPLDCTIVAIISRAGTLLRAREREFVSYGCPMSARFRLGGGIQLDFEIATQLDVSTFSTSVIGILRNELGFSVEAKEYREEERIRSISLASTAGLRDSLILGNGWREALELDLYLTHESNSTGKSVSVRGSVMPMVSRQASGSLVEYHPPNDAQRGIYAKVFDTKIAYALKGACEFGKQIDDKKIVCEGGKR